MTRKDKALLESSNRWNGSTIETQYIDGTWSECCPFFIDCGIDDCDEMTEAKINGVFGCRGISCKDCWNKTDA